MAVVGEGLLPHPRYAFATHLGKARSRSVHPYRHKVAADTCHRTRAFRYFGRRVVRTTRAKPRLTVALRAAQLQHLHGAFFGIQNGELRIHTRLGVAVDSHLFQPLRNRPGNQCG